MHMQAGVKLQTLQVTVSEAPGKIFLFQPAFIQVSTNALFNNALLHIHAVQTGSCPAEPEVFTAK